MARPLKNAIHEATYQIKDFFIDESMKRVYPKNPYNILWFMEELITKEELKQPNWVNFKNYVLECLRNNNNVPHNINPLKDKMIEDDLVLKRIKNIIETNNIDINTLGLATKGVRMKSDKLIEGLLNMGLNPNVADDINLPLEVALNRRNLKIAMLYWNHKDIDRFKLNKDGYSYAEIAIENKQWKFFESIIKDEPQLIYGNNDKNQLSVERILSLFDKKKFELTIEDIKNKERLELKKEKFVSNLVPERIKKIIVELIKFCDQKNGAIDISNPVIKKLWKEKMHKDFNEKFQEKNNKQKVKKVKI